MFSLGESKFRHDINGLRAWAVVPVVLFHFSLLGFSGGYAGVDIFFVISGFLMTDIIVTQLANNRFQFGSFYFARAKRIFPALIVLILSLLFVGWFVLPTPDYQALGSQSGYALGFISNIEFAGADSYFDSNAHEKWLLHTWSLAVEWQFYIIYPLLLWGVYRLFRANLAAIFLVLLVLFVVSFIHSWQLAVTSPNHAFYLLPSRAWEMVAGGLVFFLSRLNTPIRIPQTLYVLAWICLLAPFFLADGNTVWPAPWAIFSVLGTMLILLAAREECKLTRLPIAQWLGDRSYSLYLWHWPLAVVLYFIDAQSNLMWITGMLLLSVLLGDLSYRWIERPTRQWIGGFKKRWAGPGLVFVLCLAYMPAAVVKEAHFSDRVPQQVDKISAEANNFNPLRHQCQAGRSDGEPVGCTYGDGEQLGAIVLGDSHAGAVVRAVERSLGALQESHHILDWTASSCAVIAGLKRTDRATFACDRFIEEVMEAHLDIPAEVPLLIVSRFAQALEGDVNLLSAAPIYYLSEPYSEKSEAYYAEMMSGIVGTACYFAETRPVYMLRPIPEMPVNVPQVMSRSLLFEGEAQRVRLSIEDYYQRQKRVLAAQDKAAKACGVKLLDVTAYFCDESYCWGDSDGRPLYVDDDHLSEYGADFLRPQFELMLSHEFDHHSTAICASTSCLRYD